MQGSKPAPKRTDAYETARQHLEEVVDEAPKRPLRFSFALHDSGGRANAGDRCTANRIGIAIAAPRAGADPSASTASGFPLRDLGWLQPPRVHATQCRPDRLEGRIRVVRVQNSEPNQCGG